MSTLGAMRVDEMLAALAAKTPTPGGGAVAGATGALACGLAGMVVAYSVGKKDLAAHRPRLEQASADLAAWRTEFLELADADAAAYGKLNALQKAGAPAGEIAAAVEAAVAVPASCVKRSVELLRVCLELAPITNTYLRSDLAIAGILGESAARAGLWNVRVNTPLMADADRRGILERECEGLAVEAAKLRNDVEAACR
ncbi:MAG: cyclodeaminase/cyclohydrolase family protein [Phycisphaerales bacterium]